MSNREEIRIGKDSGRVKVFARVRPLNKDEISKKLVEAVEVSEENCQINVLDSKKKFEKTYQFDHVFSSSQNNEKICEQLSKPMVNSALEGFNGTLIAYGQTGTGKTHTLMAPDGITHDIINKVFERTHSDVNHEFKVTASYLQIYQEKIHDLLNMNSKVELNIRESPKLGVYVENQTEYVVRSPAEALSLIAFGRRRLVFAETKMNRTSSRSHSVFQMTIEKAPKKEKSMHEKMNDKDARNLKNEQVEKDENVVQLMGLENDVIVRGKIHLCDLAGSERVKKTHAAGERLSEAQCINSSLLELGNVIQALADNRKTHIPFRNSVLTRLLQESLGGNCKTNLIVCVSPTIRDISETKSTLNFGSRAMKVTNTAYVNMEVDFKRLSDSLLLKLEQKELELQELRNAKNSLSKQQLNDLLSKVDLISEESLKAIEAMKMLYENQVTSLKSEVSKLETEIANKDEQILKLQSELNAMNEVRNRENELATSLLASEVTSLQLLTAKETADLMKQKADIKSSHQQNLVENLLLNCENLVKYFCCFLRNTPPNFNASNGDTQLNLNGSVADLTKNWDLNRGVTQKLDCYRFDISGVQTGLASMRKKIDGFLNSRPSSETNEESVANQPGLSPILDLYRTLIDKSFLTGNIVLENYALKSELSHLTKENETPKIKTDSNYVEIISKKLERNTFDHADVEERCSDFENALSKIEDILSQESETDKNVAPNDVASKDDASRSENSKMRNDNSKGKSRFERQQTFNIKRSVETQTNFDELLTLSGFVEKVNEAGLQLGMVQKSKKAASIESQNMSTAIGRVEERKIITLDENQQFCCIENTGEVVSLKHFSKLENTRVSDLQKTFAAIARSVETQTNLDEYETIGVGESFDKDEKSLQHAQELEINTSTDKELILIQAKSTTTQTEFDGRVCCGRDGGKHCLSIAKQSKDQAAKYCHQNHIVTRTIETQTYLDGFSAGPARDHRNFVNRIRVLKSEEGLPRHEITSDKNTELTPFEISFFEDEDAEFNGFISASVDMSNAISEYIKLDSEIESLRSQMKKRSSRYTGRSRKNKQLKNHGQRILESADISAKQVDTSSNEVKKMCFDKDHNKALTNGNIVSDKSSDLMMFDDEIHRKRDRCELENKIVAESRPRDQAVCTDSVEQDEVRDKGNNDRISDATSVEGKKRSKSEILLVQAGRNKGNKIESCASDTVAGWEYERAERISRLITDPGKGKVEQSSASTDESLERENEDYPAKIEAQSRGTQALISNHKYNGEFQVKSGIWLLRTKLSLLEEENKKLTERLRRFEGNDPIVDCEFFSKFYPDNQHFSKESLLMPFNRNFCQDSEFPEYNLTNNGTPPIPPCCFCHRTWRSNLFYNANKMSCWHGNSFYPTWNWLDECSIVRPALDKVDKKNAILRNNSENKVCNNKNYSNRSEAYKLLLNVDNAVCIGLNGVKVADKDEFSDVDVKPSALFADEVSGQQLSIKYSNLTDNTDDIIDRTQTLSFSFNDSKSMPNNANKCLKLQHYEEKSHLSPSAKDISDNKQSIFKHRQQTSSACPLDLAMYQPSNGCHSREGLQESSICGQGTGDTSEDIKTLSVKDIDFLATQEVDNSRFNQKQMLTDVENFHNKQTLLYIDNDSRAVSESNVGNHELVCNFSDSKSDSKEINHNLSNESSTEFLSAVHESADFEEIDLDEELNRKLEIYHQTFENICATEPDVPENISEEHGNVETKGVESQSNAKRGFYEIANHHNAPLEVQITSNGDEHFYGDSFLSPLVKEDPFRFDDLGMKVSGSDSLCSLVELKALDLKVESAGEDIVVKKAWSFSNWLRRKQPKPNQIDEVSVVIQ